MECKPIQFSAYSAITCLSVNVFICFDYVAICWCFLHDSCMFTIIWFVIYSMSLCTSGSCIILIVHICLSSAPILIIVLHIMWTVIHIVLIFCPEDSPYVEYIGPLGIAQP